MRFCVYVTESVRADDSILYEALLEPGGLIGLGSTPEEALRSLAGLMEWTRAEEDFVAWYGEASRE